MVRRTPCASVISRREARVDELKDQIRRSHTRLALLSDTILSGGAAGSRAEVVFRNEMSSAFRLTRALFVVDGAVQYNRQDDTGALADQKEIPIFNGSMPPGDHTVQVVLNFQGNGYGVFTYLRGYKFEVKSAHSFTAVEGKTLSLQATALEKGGVTTPLEQRPTIEWGEKIASLAPGGSGSTPPSSGVKTEGSTTSNGASGSIQLGGGK
ncbi:MAG: dihydrolipoamide acetyltransferase [Myxococcales bacterium]|nr:dihydrolipoamide acetyltransferase [Myxococcales bacterium]